MSSPNQGPPQDGAEQPQADPEQWSQEVIDNTTQLMEDMARTSHYEVTALQPEEVMRLPEITDWGIQNEGLGITQTLRCIVKADFELFGIEDVLTPDASAQGGQARQVAVTYLRPGDPRAELIGFVEPGKQFIVGRDPQAELGLDMGTSSKHFSVALAEDGSIGIADLDSLNGTDVITPKSNNTTSTILRWKYDNFYPFGDRVPAWSMDSSAVKEALKIRAQTDSMLDLDRIMELKDSIDRRLARAEQEATLWGNQKQIGFDRDELKQEITQEALESYFGAPLAELANGKKVPIGVQETVKQRLDLPMKELEAQKMKQTEQLRPPQAVDQPDNELEGEPEEPRLHLVPPLPDDELHADILTDNGEPSEEPSEAILIDEETEAPTEPIAVVPESSEELVVPKRKATSLLIAWHGLSATVKGELSRRANNKRRKLEHRSKLYKEIADVGRAHLAGDTTQQLTVKSRGLSERLAVQRLKEYDNKIATAQAPLPVGLKTEARQEIEVLEARRRRLLTRVSNKRATKAQFDRSARYNRTRQDQLRR